MTYTGLLPLWRFYLSVKSPLAIWSILLLRQCQSGVEHGINQLLFWSCNQWNCNTYNVYVKVPLVRSTPAWGASAIQVLKWMCDFVGVYQRVGCYFLPRQQLKMSVSSLLSSSYVKPMPLTALTAKGESFEWQACEVFSTWYSPGAQPKNVILGNLIGWGYHGFMLTRDFWQFYGGRYILTKAYVVCFCFQEIVCCLFPSWCLTWEQIGMISL